jgi:putative hydroxymethylpyrimidine transport system substrate-binding protein
MRRLAKTISLAAAVAAMVALLAGCGGGGADAGTTSSAPILDSLYVDLDGYPGPENVGILMAEKRGYFEDAGLSVEIYTPGSPRFSVHYALNGSAELAVSHQPQVILDREKGLPVIAVGSVVSQPTAAMIWLKESGIENISDLKGKTIAIPGLSFQRELLKEILARAGLTPGEVTVEAVDYELVSALEEGSADVIFGGSWNVEGAELEARGLRPVVTRVDSLGIPPYDELVVVAPRDRLADQGSKIRAFMSAVTRGAAAAAEAPAEAVQAIEEVGEPNPKFDRKAAEAGVKATLPLLSRSGRMDPGKARGLANWMHEQGMTQREPPVASLFSNRYLPAS